MSGSSGIFDLGARGRGRDLALQLTAGFMVQSVDFIFSPSLSQDDIKGIQVLSAIAKSIADEDFHHERFGSHLVRGRWAAARETASVVADSTKTTPDEAFRAALGLLVVPSCFIDMFSIAAVHGGNVVKNFGAPAH